MDELYFHRPGVENGVLEESHTAAPQLSTFGNTHDLRSHRPLPL